MGLFSKFRVDDNNVERPDWYKKLQNVFGYLDIEDQGIDKGVALSDRSKLSPIAASGENGDIMGAQFYGNVRRYVNYDEPTKEQKLRVYRQMAEYAEIKYALSMICDEIINYNDLDGSVGRLIIDNESLVKNINIKTNLQKEWKYVFDELMNFKDTGRDAILSFLISGELMYEKVLNPEKKHEGLKRVKRLRPDNIFPVWSEHYDDVSYFRLGGVGDSTGQHVGGEIIPRSQIAYSSWDHYSQNNHVNDIYVVSYLEPVKKVWRQLQLLEEAVVIYRIVRAPERRVFKVATGNMPRAQAEEYVQKLMRTYRQKKIYNTSTGEIDGQNNILSMLEDYWFSQPSDGNSTQIDTLPGGEKLGEITDLNYFLEKLYRSLEIPANRRLDHFSGDQKFNVGNVTDISWQEVKFAKMVNRVRRNVISCLHDIFKTHLKLKGLWYEYSLKDSDFRIELNRNNFFEEMKRAQVEETRLNAWGVASTYIDDVFSKEWAAKHFLKIENEDWEKNMEMLQKERMQGENIIQGSSSGGSSPL